MKAIGFLSIARQGHSKRAPTLGRARAGSAIGIHVTPLPSKLTKNTRIIQRGEQTVHAATQWQVVVIASASCHYVTHLART